VFPAHATQRAIRVAARVRLLGWDAARLTLVEPLGLDAAEEQTLWVMVERVLSSQGEEFARALRTPRGT